MKLLKLTAEISANFTLTADDEFQILINTNNK
jgi:hypothetical protein